MKRYILLRTILLFCVFVVNGRVLIRDLANNYYLFRERATNSEQKKNENILLGISNKLQHQREGKIPITCEKINVLYVTNI